MFATKLPLLILILSPLISCQRDDTLVERRIGKDVAEAVVRRILRSQIFRDDASFLLRVAYAESRFGESTSTFRPGYYGGIWQVDEHLFNMTKVNSTTLSPFHAQIETSWGINWLAVSWTDLLKPLYSGLAARLFFAQVPPMPNIPDTINRQALHWKNYYRQNGSAEAFISDARELQNATSCRGKIDLCIVLDGSGSVSVPAFIQAKEFVASTIQSFTLDYTRIGLVVYSSSPYQIFPVENNYTITEMSDLARNATHPRGGTDTGLAMIEGVGLLKSAAVQDGIPQVMTVFTDGQSNFPVTPGVEAARNNNISTFAVGIGDGVVYSELLEIGQNRQENVFELTDFDALTDFIFRLTSITCELPQRPVINETYNDSLIQNERRYYTMVLPPAGITVVLHITIGKVKGYWSYTEETPTEAVHDGVIDGPTHIPVPPPEMLRFGLGLSDSKLSDNEVYITIEGTEENNRYQIETQEGDQVPEQETTTTPTTRRTTTPRITTRGTTSLVFLTTTTGNENGAVTNSPIFTFIFLQLLVLLPYL